MAKFDLKFIDCVIDTDFIRVVLDNQYINDEETVDLINISGVEGNKPFTICLDKSTAIKFAKTLRTEINKIVE
tara:strand:+ start:509 stop:727 length:219 start_codon:yes stop_codon:yes gene_type:complete